MDSNYCFLLLHNLNLSCNSFTINYRLNNIYTSCKTIDSNGVALSGCYGSTSSRNNLYRRNVSTSNGDIVITLSNLNTTDSVVCNTSSTNEECSSSTLNACTIYLLVSIYANSMLLSILRTEVVAKCRRCKHSSILLLAINIYIVAYSRQ